MIACTSDTFVREQSYSSDHHPVFTEISLSPNFSIPNNTRIKVINVNWEDFEKIEALENKFL